MMAKIPSNLASMPKQHTPPSAERLHEIVVKMQADLDWRSSAGYQADVIKLSRADAESLIALLQNGSRPAQLQ
jgi:hypothetical protein